MRCSVIDCIREATCTVDVMTLAGDHDTAEVCAACYKEHQMKPQLPKDLHIKLASNAEENQYVARYHWIKREDLIRLMWTNTHRIALIDADKYLHIRINRKDRKKIRDWHELQEVKNIAVGKEVFAMEVHPPQSKVVDSANTYHLFVPKDQSAVPDLTAIYNYSGS